MLDPFKESLHFSIQLGIMCFDHVHMGIIPSCILSVIRMAPGVRWIDNMIPRWSVLEHTVTLPFHWSIRTLRYYMPSSVCSFAVTLDMIFKKVYEQGAIAVDHGIIDVVQSDSSFVRFTLQPLECVGGSQVFRNDFALHH
jgi:hypothetical protein